LATLLKVNTLGRKQHNELEGCVGKAREGMVYEQS
jgi:hypothetical protein